MELEVNNDKLKHILEANRITNKKNHKFNCVNQQLMLVVEESRREEAKRELEWTRRWRKSSLNKQIVTNVQELLGALQRWAYHLSLFHYLIKNMSCATALNLFNTSSSTYQQAHQLQDIPLLQMKYKPFTKKKRIYEEQIRLAHEIIDHCAPIQVAMTITWSWKMTASSMQTMCKIQKNFSPCLSHWAKPILSIRYKKEYDSFFYLNTCRCCTHRKYATLKTLNSVHGAEHLRSLICGPLDDLQTKKRAKCLHHQVCCFDHLY